MNFYAPFIVDLAKKTADLYELLKKTVSWSWTSVHENAIAVLKKEIMSKQVLAPYDPFGPLTLTTDASPVGIGGVLQQNGRPIAFVSKKLNDTQQRYSQLDREALAIIWSVKRLNRFLAYRSFVIETDHKPLEYIFSSKKDLPDKTSLRVQRWAEQLSLYKYEIQGKRTNEIPHADALSRLPIDGTHDADKVACSTVCNSVNFVNQIDLAMTDERVLTRADLEASMVNDKELMKIMADLQSGSKLQEPFGKFEQRLSVNDKLLYLDDRIIVPKSLRKQVLNLLHASHPGMQVMKNLAKQHVWWPRITVEIKAVVVKKCCLLNSPP